jgi:hypothetical protein
LVKTQRTKTKRVRVIPLSGGENLALSDSITPLEVRLTSPRRETKGRESPEITFRNSKFRLS